MRGALVLHSGITAAAAAAVKRRRAAARVVQAWGRQPERNRRRGVAAAAFDPAALAGVLDASALDVAGAALDALLGGAPAAFAAECGPETAAEAPMFGLPTEAISILLTGAVAAGVPLLFSKRRGSSVKTVSPAEAVQLLAAEGALLVDVRSEALAVRGRSAVPRSAAIPWVTQADGAPHRNVNFADDVIYAAGAAPIVVVDTAGAHAAAAARKLSRKCKNAIYVIDGGFKAWAAAGQAVEGDAGAALEATAVAAEAAAVEAAGSGRDFHLGAPFRPKLLTVLAEGYGLNELRTDVLAGLSVGVIALSLSMALGIASDSTPAAGLYTAVSAGFIVSALGGSRVAIGGPTAAFIPVVVGVAHNYGAEALVTCTVLSGGMLIVMGLTGMGTIITKIPRPVVTGFTAGIATFIFSTQLKDFFGLENVGHVPSQFLEKVVFLAGHLDATHLPSLALASSCVVFLRLYPAAWARVVPPQILVVAGSMAALHLCDMAGVATGIETIQTRFGADAIPTSLPVPHLTIPTLDDVGHLLPPAFTIALLAAIESLLCAVVSDGFIGDKHDSNTELVAQGLANIASASVGGLPATGALARTAANVRCGGSSPISGMVHACTVLAIMLVAAPLAAYIPLPALSAVLVIVAVNMGEWRNFAAIADWPRGDALIYLTAFMLTVLTDVTVAVESGLVLSLLMSLKRTSDSTVVMPPALMSTRARAMLPPLASGVDVLQLSGTLFFGCTGSVEAAVERASADAATRVLILDCGLLLAVDATGLEVLEEARHKLDKAGKQVVLCDLRHQAHAALSNAGLLARIGHANVVSDQEEAAMRAAELLGAHAGNGSNGSAPLLAGQSAR